MLVVGVKERKEQERPRLRKLGGGIGASGCQVYCRGGRADTTRLVAAVQSAHLTYFCISIFHAHELYLCFYV